MHVSDNSEERINIVVLRCFSIYIVTKRVDITGIRILLSTGWLIIRVFIKWHHIKAGYRFVKQGADLKPINILIRKLKAAIR